MTEEQQINEQQSNNDELQKELDNCNSNSKTLNQKIEIYSKLYKDTVKSKYNYANGVCYTLIAVVGLILLIFVILSCLSLKAIDVKGFTIANIIIIVVSGGAAAGIWLGLLKKYKNEDIKTADDEDKLLNSEKYVKTILKRNKFVGY